MKLTACDQLSAFLCEARREHDGSHELDASVAKTTVLPVIRVYIEARA